MTATSGIQNPDLRSLLYSLDSPLSGVAAQQQRKVSMTRSLDVINEVIRTHNKNPFRQMADRPGKALKHRYERRKVKQYIHTGDWADEARP
jgi:hypothetical protein